MGTFTFRVVVDTEEDIFRDIEIGKHQHFEMLHDAIIEAFGFQGDQMASFYMSNENWEKGKEIGLMDVSSFDGDDSVPNMKNTPLEVEVTSQYQKILYVYDFLKMWVFYIELIADNDTQISAKLPSIVREFGTSPNEEDKEMPDLFEGIEMNFDSEENKDDLEMEDDPFNEFDDAYDEY